MEVLEKRIAEFLKIETGYGSGSGSGSGYNSGFGYGSGSGSGDGSDDGDGYGSGSGSGDGSDDGDGYGYGSGFGSGYGYGYGSGSGSGDGSDDGDGYGYGSGSGSGYGYGILQLNNYKVFDIDEIATIITNVKNNIAKGFLLNNDLTLTPCFIAKGQNMFAHGATIKEAMQSLEEKIFANLDVEGKIIEFKKIFKTNIKYSGYEFYKWHHLLTGSCVMGRDSFVKNNDLDLTNKYTVKEFVAICKNAYGGSIIKKLEEHYEQTD